MKAPKSIKRIKEKNGINSFLVAAEILQHRPSMRNRIWKDFKKYDDVKNCLYFFYYNKGFKDGYKYAIERLKRHSS